MNLELRSKRQLLQDEQNQSVHPHPQRRNMLKCHWKFMSTHTHRNLVKRWHSEAKTKRRYILLSSDVHNSISMFAKGKLRGILKRCCVYNRRHQKLIIDIDIQLCKLKLSMFVLRHSKTHEKLRGTRTPCIHMHSHQKNAKYSR